MAGSLSDVMEVDVLKALTAQTTTILTTTALANVYVALYTVTPSDSAAGTEVTGGSYARVDSKGSWGTPSAGSVANNAVITFPTATGAWSSSAALVAFALMTAITGGSMIAWGALTDTSKTVATGDTISFAIGALTITAD
jgi:hypothetical protein